MNWDRQAIKATAAALASKGVYIGTSSWKYAGWLGQLYTPSRYECWGKLAKSRLERDCLAEYAEVFKTVCVDAADYNFPTCDYLQRLADQVPDDFRFGFKVTDTFTIRRFPNLPRFGLKAGKTNEYFLNAGLFGRAFLKPCESIRPKVGVLMFEFSRFWPVDYDKGREFVAELDQFLGALPKGWPYAIEIRNRQWLHDEYFQCLARHGVTHVFNSWDAMPPVHEQLALPNSTTNPGLIAARFLLKPGRKYEDAVKAFQLAGGGCNLPRPSILSSEPVSGACPQSDPGKRCGPSSKPPAGREKCVGRSIPPSRKRLITNTPNFETVEDWHCICRMTR